MSADRPSLGILTTDDRLVVRTWDAWMAKATGVPADRALNRSIADVFPEIRNRGLLAIFEGVLSRGTVEVLAPALHQYLFSCAPATPSPAFDRMQQHVTIGPLRENGRVVGLVATVADVTDRVRRGVVASTKGRWPGHMRDGATINATVDERDSDMGGGAVFHDNRVEVTRSEILVRDDR